jgi:hypothetical protein
MPVLDAPMEKLKQTRRRLAVVNNALKAVHHRLDRLHAQLRIHASTTGIE